MKYRLQITETINHVYEIEAPDEDTARAIYEHFTNEELAALDVDGTSEWETHPWDVERMED